MGLKREAEAHRYDGLVPKCRGRQRKKGPKGSVLYGRGGVCCGR